MLQNLYWISPSGCSNCTGLWGSITSGLFVYPSNVLKRFYGIGPLNWTTLKSFVLTSSHNLMRGSVWIFETCHRRRRRRRSLAASFLTGSWCYKTFWERREPWCSGYGRRLMFQRSWVQIRVLYYGWTSVHIYLLKIL